MSDQTTDQSEISPEAREAAEKEIREQRFHNSRGYYVQQLLNASAAQQREEIAALRDGSWLDKWGGCKICDGEIPHGHTPNCHIYKLEQEITLWQGKSDTLRARLEAIRGALEEAEQTFLNYAAMHDAKQPQATQKAKSNRQAAARCRAALASEATNSTRKEGEPCAAPVPTITTPATKVAPSTEAASDGAPSSDPTDAPEVALPNMPCQICGGSGYITHGPNGGICSDCHGSGLLRPQPADGACDAARRKAAGKETL